MNAYERLLKYVVIRTPSNEESETTPSSQCQFDLANVLKKEMEELGICDVTLTDTCFLYGKIPATPGCENAPAIGFIAHMDTVSDYCDHDIKPMITENYDGEALALGESELVLSPEMFPHLKSLKGRTLITSDGTTILGADDKAGIAGILTMVERLKTQSIPHGPLCIAFTPDEETGTGASHFDLQTFGADFAYTLDGGMENGIEYETFNASSAVVEFHGVSVHPGSSKDTMINASLVAMEFDSMLPKGERPRDTDGYEGFYHLMKMEGECSYAKLNYIIRDHDAENFNHRKEIMQQIADDLNTKWGEGTVSLTLKDQYRNMREVIEQHMHLIDNAKKACEAVGLTPVCLPVRGGTDGCQLSFRGLPCPNLGTGGHAYHGPYEHITVEGMDKAVEMITELVKIYSIQCK